MAALVSAIILLARHGTHAEVGHVLSGRSEIGLSETGAAEAERLATRLAATPLDGICASPRRRTQETAMAVSARTGLPVQSAPALDEIDFGTWTGRAFAELDGDPAWHDWNARRGSAAVPGGETMAQAVARVRAFVEATAVQGGTMLYVSHCDVIRGLVSDLMGWSLDRLLDFDCNPASLTTLSLDSGHARLIALNERP
ncbi:histidine phosphatase family protein [Sphingomonas jatrophae]|uniref:Broad specificity phosphatase PhoE n=1 Tax=Sphingomonas jatrophae TaxID=1166337 RepID=A0A1I6JIB4_9SPHN|nr:histidine phosphatase family protein [Sphingomonas jatrophae]SFR78778.1 Broad specificity phosphatase PhoE [Sphingomonas jatrophae]